MSPIQVCQCIDCTLLKVVSYYDLSVLSMSVMGFQKKSLDEIEFYFGFFVLL